MPQPEAHRHPADLLAPYEVSLAALGRLTAWADEHAQGDLNEATTRLQLIDQLLIDCLAWPREHVEAERYDHGEYTDYELGYPSKRVVVEAKREGIHFSLPAGFPNSTIHIPALLRLEPAISGAISQVLSYCNTRGIPIAVISNGRQLVAFIANRQDGIAPLEGRAIVFSSLRVMLDRFPQLWDCLSLPGIDGRHIYLLLADSGTVPPPKTLAHSLVDYPGFRNRNPIATELQILGGLFLEDITRDPGLEPDFVRRTYCTSGALSQYALISKDILGARYSALLEQEAHVSASPAVTSRGVDSEITKDLLAAAMSKRPLILLGDVGVGKSMFIKHLRLVEAADVFGKSVVAYLDFGAKPALVSDLSMFVWTELESQFYSQYGIDILEESFVRSMYNGELNRFAKGINAPLRAGNPELFRVREVAYLQTLTDDKENHLRRCVSHIVGSHHKPVVVICDNVDQRTADFQEAVFLTTQSISQNWQATTFLSLRPDTFIQSRKHGTLAAYQPRVFTIDPPRVDRVIQRRLEYALAELLKTQSLSGLATGISVYSQRLERYIRMLSDAFSKSADIIEFVDNMSNGNIRRALDFVIAFIGSAHVDSTKILNIIEATGRYNLPLHECLRAVLMQDNEFYNPEDSPLPNIFDISSADAREHFLLLIVLSYLERRGQVTGAHGFVGIDDVHKFSQGLSFSESQTIIALEKVVHSSLAVSPSALETTRALRLRITTAGAYMLKRLHSMFTYMDAVVVDTPILDKTFSRQIQDTRTIGERLERCEAFRSYLDSCWSDGLGELYSWPAHSAASQVELVQIRSRLN